jgi:DNA-binding SARP family transcriptional activator/DNA-binding beta-propeller fold protein YncE
VEFRILGSVEVVDDGRPIAIRRGKELALLAYLLLHANEVIPSERLIDELWGEMSPSTAPKILQNAVSHLRRALGEDRIATRGPGYVLRVEDGELDVKEFDRLAREGKPEAALGLWRGTPLLELRAERFADDARRQLDERRVAILEDRIDADLAAGRDAEVVAELKELIAEHPLRERLHGQLMTALYRAGRQGEALEAYQRARKTLSSELGLDPGPELQELERKILKQDPAIAAPPAKRPARRPAAPPIPRRFALLGILGVLLIAAAVGVGLTLSHGDKHLIVRPNSLVVIDPNGNRIVGVVPVGNTPRGVAVGTKAVWVTNSADGTVSEVDPKQLKVTQTIGIGARATDAVVAAGRVWIATGSDNSLVQIDERAGGVVGRLSLSPDPSASAHAVAATSDAIWVASGDLLYKIDPASGNVVAHSHEHVGTGNSCCFGINDVAVGFGAAWVADISELVVRLSSASVRETGSAQLGVIPPAIAVGEGGVWLALPDPVAQRVALWRVDPLTVRITETITLGKGLGYPPTLELAVGGGAIWVSNFDAGTLVRVDPKLGVVTDTIRIGHHPFGVAFGANRVWVTVS